MKIPILLIAAVFTCASCSREPKINIFKTQKELTAQVIIQGKKLIDPWDIELKDSLLIVANAGGRPLLEIYNTNGKLISKGLPADQKQITLVGLIQSTDVGGLLYVNDMHSRNVFTLTLHNLLKNPVGKPNILSDVVGSRSNEYEKKMVTNKFIISESASPKGRIWSFNKSDHQTKYYLRYPAKINKKLTDQKNAKLFSSSFAISPDQTKVGMATYNCDMLNIMHVSSQGLDSVWSNYYSLPNNIKVEKFLNAIQYFVTDETIKGYLHTDASNRYFYALYSGKRCGDPDRQFANTIRAISWDGKQALEYHCNRLIKRIAVSADDRFLYAIAVNKRDDSPEIIKFNLK
ncbi:hypothetical protein [Mucilaginibacter sp. HD30]